MPLEKPEFADVLISSRGTLVVVAGYVFSPMAAAIVGAGAGGASGSTAWAFFAAAVTLVAGIMITRRGSAWERRTNCIILAQDNFVFRRGGVEISYPWNRLRNARIEDRYIYTMA